LINWLNSSRYFVSSNSFTFCSAHPSLQFFGVGHKILQTALVNCISVSYDVKTRKLMIRFTWDIVVGSLQKCGLFHLWLKSDCRHFTLRVTCIAAHILKVWKKKFTILRCEHNLNIEKFSLSFTEHGVCTYKY